MDTTFALLHSLRVKGLAGAAVLSGLSGIAEDDLPGACQPLVDDGLVMARGGAMAGYMLTPKGKAEADRVLAEDPETAAGRDALVAFDEAFLPYNTRFKKICHSWQMRDDGQPNDHSDTDYDASVIDGLTEFHGEFLPLLNMVSEPMPRFGRYAGRLDAALGRLRGGDSSAFARPMADSYHDIWMELHNDVVLSMQRERTSADEG